MRKRPVILCMRCILGGGRNCKLLRPVMEEHAWTEMWAEQVYGVLTH